VWPLGVVLDAKGIEAPLLARTRALHRRDRAPFHRPMHPLVRTVLLRLPRMNALVRDPGGSTGIGQM
jgi:hypothetical protein